ncbi:MAG: helix-turn-helix domain-containing protein [Bacteroidota bacterium]
MDHFTDISDNPEVFLAGQYALYTHASIFLTGKAGTGKTTFLKNLRASALKKIAVAAPTGIAAINANGVTLHSLFQLPMGTFIPDDQLPADGQFYNRNFLARNTRMSNDKRRLLQEIELLVIDEVSMLRCDLLDAIDSILQRVRKNRNPFGDLQVLFIGDLQQLPPVVQDREWDVLNRYYQTPFFFSSHAYQQLRPVYIELSKIYRQKEESFIGLLENVRRNELSEQDLQLLNDRLNVTEAAEGEVTLTTHNYRADQINQERLKVLKGQSVAYMGMINGDFNEKNLPTEMNLVLKKGAQVMFIKNNTEKGYYNGCMGIVKSVEEKKIVVDVEGIADSITVDREVWQTVKYTHNQETNKIDEEETGSFSQYPLKLAWAITIHKSQGLTFDRIRVDAADAFAAGQVYVALSRCRTLDGITLTSRLGRQAVQTDQRLKSELLTVRGNEFLMTELTEAKKLFARQQLKLAFRFLTQAEAVVIFKEFLQEKSFGDKETTAAVINLLESRILALEDTGVKFIRQLEDHFSSSADPQWLQERIGKAIGYFARQFFTEIVEPLDKLHDMLSPKKGTKQVCARLYVLKESMWNKLERIQGIHFDDFDFSAFHQPIQRKVEEDAKPKKTKAVKGETYTETLEMFSSGKTMEEIAEIRGLAFSTIEGHLARFIPTGEVSLDQLLSPEAIKSISLALDKFSTETVTGIRERLGNTYTYSQIRMVAASRVES